MSKFTNAEKAKEALREVEMRERVYTRKAGNRQLSQIDQKRIELMMEIAEEYGALAKKEHLL